MTTTQYHQRRGPLGGGATLGPLRPALGRLGALALLIAAGGCPSPDPAAKYDRFNQQTEDDRDRPEPKLDFGGPPIGGETDTDGEGYPDITGTFLVAVDTSIAPGLPLQFLAEVTAEVDETGTGTINVEFQPLSLDAMSTTEPREEVGETLNIDGDIANGSFALEFGMTDIVGAANPITGSDIVADIVLMGTIRNMDAWCGVSTGDVISPLQASLEGSTFGAMRLADRDERPGEGQFPVSCETVDSLGIGMDDDDAGTTTGM